VNFIPSLELSRMLYEEQIAPTMAERFPDLRYAAATMGMCSEVLGLDDEVSMDHEWGPRSGVLGGAWRFTHRGGQMTGGRYR
jgi:hypothetical protein